MPVKWNDIAAKVLRGLAREGRYADLARRLVLILLVLLVARSGAELTWIVLGEATAETGSGAAEPFCAAPAPMSETEPEAGVALASLHLFGQAERALPAKEEAAAPAEAPQTTLNLVLKGVIASSSRSRALAVINEKGGKGPDLVYGVDDEVPGNARIEGIYADRVLLRRAGKLETLYLENPEEKPPAAKAGVAAGRGNHRTLNRAYVEKKIANIPELAKEVGVEVYTRNGQQYGYKLVSAGGSRFLDNMGLQAGDILYEVNGIRLSNASNALTAYEKLQKAPEISLVIERGGKRQTTTFSIK